MLATSRLVEALSRLVPQPITWLWPGRLARGKLSVFDGDPELGKSLVTLDLCARVTTGRPFPDGSPGIDASNVVIVNAEDAADDTVAPRLRALGADLDRVFIFRNDFLDNSGPFRLPMHTAILEQVLAETSAALLVLDPIMAFFDASIQIGSDMSVRRALSPLAEISSRRNCHTIMVRHINKSGHFRSLYRGGGSIGILAACRSAFLFARDPNDPLRCIMAQMKNNLAARQPSLAYRIRLHESGQPVPEWLAESPLTADQLLTAAGIKPALPGKSAEASDFIRAFLEDGPRSTIDIWQAAQEQGIAKRTLQRIAPECKIRSQRVWVNGVCLVYWLRQGQQLPTEIDPPKPDRPSLEPWLAPLRAQYPDDPLDSDQ